MKWSTWIALLVFIGLGVTVSFVLRAKPERGITRVSFRNLRLESVTAIVIEGANGVELRKSGGVWMLGNKKADESAVKRLLDSVAAMESTEIVTRNRARFAELEVEGEKATHVTLLSDGETVADFFVGAATSGGSHVRVNDAVYAVPAVYRGTFSRVRTGWLDLVLFSDVQDDVQKVEVRLRGEVPYALVRAGEEWQLEDASLFPPGHRFDRAAARRLVASLISARAADIPEEDPGTEVSGLTDDADMWRFYVGGKEGEATIRTLQLGAQAQSGQVYARASTRADLVTVPAYVAGNLRKRLADLRDWTVMSLDSARVARLALIAAKKRLVLERSGSEWRVVESSEKIPEHFVLDPGAVRRRLAEVAEVRALAEAPTTSAKTSRLKRPSAQVLVTNDDGSLLALKFGAETKWNEQGAVFAQGNADDRVYLVSTRERDRLLGGIDTFARREPPPGPGNLDPEALRNLPPEVRDGLLRQLAEQKQRQRLLESLEAGEGTGAK